MCAAAAVTVQAEGSWGFCVFLAEYNSFFFFFPSFFQASCKHAVGQQSWEEPLPLNASQVHTTDFLQLGQGSSSWETTGYEFLITAVIKTRDDAKPASAMHLRKFCLCGHRR